MSEIDNDEQEDQPVLPDWRALAPFVLQASFKKEGALQIAHAIDSYFEYVMGQAIGYLESLPEGAQVELRNVIAAATGGLGAGAEMGAGMGLKMGLEGLDLLPEPPEPPPSSASAMPPSPSTSRRIRFDK